jgi:hypothetical protein
MQKGSVMLKRVIGIVALASLVGAPSVFAQEAKAEVSVLFGWTFSDGVDGQSVKALDGNIYNRIDPKDSFKWGFQGAGLIGPNYEVGFMFTQQLSTLQVSGTNTKDIGDMTTNNYHGYIGYNFFDADEKVRPYFQFGLGATSFGSVDYVRLNGAAGSTQSSTRFSTTWGGGIKAFPSPHVGIRIGAQWTPTYIKSDATGYWCDPYWGCYLVGNAKYANQLDLTGGLTFRF